MTFLLPGDYHSIIEVAIDLNEKDIQHYFFNQYQQHNSTNPNFVDKLKETICELENRFNLLIQRHNSSWEEAKGFCEGQGKEYKVRKITDWNNESFFYLNGVLNKHFPIVWNGKEYKRFTINKFNEIKSGFEEFIRNLETFKLNKNIPKNNIPTTPIITLTQKIHLLKMLGFFELVEVEKLDDTRKGNLVSLLLQTSKKNTTDRIRERHSVKDIKTDIEKLYEILVELKLEKIVAPTPPTTTN